MFQYEAVVLRIVDGDTLWLNLDLGFKVHVEIDVRLAHINAPELVHWTESGLSDPAITYVTECVPPGSTCVVDISKADKYGRWLGVVRFLPGVTDRYEIIRSGRVLNDELKEKGFAVSYGK